MKFANPQYIEKGLNWMQNYGQWIVVSNRFLAGTRSVIALTAGASRMPILPTIMSATLSSVLWNSLLLYAGWFLGDNWRIIGQYLEQYSKAILVVLMLSLGFAYLWYKLRKK
jgi:membrane protein DedA with SNARE-associated domain